METKLRISKNNALIDASYRLSLTEMQIVLYGIGLINPLQKNFPLSYRVDIDRFAKMFDRRHGQIYKEVKEAVVKRFWERDFSYIDEKGKTVTLRWLTKMVHEDKTGYIEIKFSEEVQPYLHALQGNFTAYYIEQISKFKSVYSVRLYEHSLMVLNKNKTNKDEFTLLISEIKKQLEVTDKYDRFTNFKVRVLEKSKKEINDFSDLVFDYEVIKLGRYPHEIKFTISKKQSVNRTENTSNKLSALSKDNAKKIVIESGTGWDLHAIESQFYAYIEKKGPPKNIDKAFIGFVNKKTLCKA
jgi:plasmid replication initiation protein